MKRTYGRLVRDRVPQLIEESGGTATTRVLDESGYREALLDKIIDEVEEFRVTGNEEEIADIFELLDCLTELKGFEPMHIDYVKLIKREARGSYRERILLEEVEDPA